jgi:hypothetical protein
VKRQPVDSEAITSIGYDAERRELEIEFADTGDIYLYFDVPAEEYQAFMAAGSKGTYLNQVFKAREYSYRITRRGK